MSFCCLSLIVHAYVTFTQLLLPLVISVPFVNTLLYSGKAAMGAWCMQRELAERVSTLLGTNTDQDLRWDGTDDGGFYGQVMKPIGVNLVSSDNWYSQIHQPMPARNGGFKKINNDHSHNMRLEWKKDKSFMEVWWPTAAVFNDKYGYATQAA